MILFRIHNPIFNPEHKAIIWAHNRESAKVKARACYINGHPDHFVVEPITNPFDTVHFDLTLKG